MANASAPASLSDRCPSSDDEGLAHQPAQVDLHRAQHGELEVEEGDHLAVPQRVHQREVAVVDDLLDDGRGSVVVADDLVEPRPLHIRQTQRSTDAIGCGRGVVQLLPV